MGAQEIEPALARRLPSTPEAERKKLARAYFEGVEAHAQSRTNGPGPVPTNLGTERGELLAAVSRAMGRLLTEGEIAALLRITPTAARTVRRAMVAVHDDLPVLALASAFSGAARAGRGSAGGITDGYKVSFSSAEKMEIAQEELARQGFLWEVAASSGSSHVLLVDKTFPISEVLADADE
jgi:hypothetical protein